MSNLLDMIVSNDEAVKRHKKEPPKKQKVKKAAKPISDDEKESGELINPTQHELEEAQKPSNIPENNSIRSKKRKQHKINVQSKKTKVDIQMHLEIAEYLKRWKYEKDDWKYQKARQIYLQKFILDEQKVIEDVWALALEYISNTQGNGKELLINTCKSLIEKLDKKSEVEKTLHETIEYQRARQLLQNFQ